jgi:hypothetical protein
MKHSSKDLGFSLRIRFRGSAIGNYGPDGRRINYGSTGSGTQKSVKLRPEECSPCNEFDLPA